MSLTRQCLLTAVLSQVAMLHCILKHQIIYWKDLKILKINEPQMRKECQRLLKDYLHLGICS